MALRDKVKTNFGATKKGLEVHASPPLAVLVTANGMVPLRYPRHGHPPCPLSNPPTHTFFFIRGWMERALHPALWRLAKRLASASATRPPLRCASASTTTLHHRKTSHHAPLYARPPTHPRTQPKHTHTAPLREVKGFRARRRRPRAAKGRTTRLTVTASGKTEVMMLVPSGLYGVETPALSSE